MARSRKKKKSSRRKIRKMRKIVRKTVRKGRKIRRKVKAKKARRATPKKRVVRKAKKAVRKPTRPAVAPAASTPPPPPIPEVQLREGDPAPDFYAQTDEGNVVSLGELRGRKVVLYFYPKDDTPGCTKEACAFRDGIAQIQARGAAVLGASVDSVDSHKRFKEKFNLNFPLLADEDKKIVQAYGVWKEKSMYGRTYMGIERTTFLIDEAGRIQKIFPKVDVEVHYDEVLQALG